MTESILRHLDFCSESISISKAEELELRQVFLFPHAINFFPSPQGFLTDLVRDSVSAGQLK